MNTPVLSKEERGTSAYLSILWVHHPCSLQLGNMKYRCQKNDVILCRQGIVYDAGKADQLSAFSFSPDWFDDLFHTQISDCRILMDFLMSETGNQEHLFFRCQKDPDPVVYLEQLQKELEIIDDIHVKKMSHLLIIAMMTSLERSHHETLIVNNSTMVSDNRFGKILKYIGDHYNTCTLKETAEVFGYQPDYLSQLFRKVTGQTFTEKLRSIRMEEARTMLLSSEISIEEIAGTVGFHDRSWFIRHFRQSYGMTPGAYRRQYRNEK
ncbi:MAG: AraC family transcriptional regulator [Bulleidia sp.]|nr:AraC family transcriptional regulator [Bulleidia sp.]